MTKKLGGQRKDRFEELNPITKEVKIDWNEWKKFKQEVKAADGDTIKIKVAIDDSELQDLKRIDGLYDYAVEQSKLGKDVDLGSINALIQTQNYKNIAEQAHGILGVKQAIDKYNEGIEKEDFDTEKFIEAITSSNSALGKYFSSLKGVNDQYNQGSIGLGGYAGSLAVAALKTLKNKTTE